MSDTQDDVLFRIGFQAHPESETSLGKLAQQVIDTQRQISESVKGTGDDAVEQVDRIASALEKMKKDAPSSRASQRPTKRIADSKPSESVLQSYRTHYSVIEALREADVRSASSRIANLEKLAQRESLILSKRPKPKSSVVAGPVSSDRSVRRTRSTTNTQRPKERDRTIVTTLSVDATDAIAGRERDVQSATERIKSLQSLSVTERAIATKNGDSLKTAVKEAVAASTVISKARQSVSSPAKLTIDVSGAIEGRKRDAASSVAHARAIAKTSSSIKREIGELGQLPTVSTSVKLSVDNSAAIEGRERDLQSAKNRLGVIESLASQESAIQKQSVSAAQSHRSKLSEIAEDLESSLKRAKPITMKVGVESDTRGVERLKSSISAAKPMAIKVGIKGTQQVRQSVATITKDIEKFQKSASIEARAKVVVDDSALAAFRSKQASSVAAPGTADKMEKLASAAIESQKRIDSSVVKTGDVAIEQVNRIEAAIGRINKGDSFKKSQQIVRPTQRPRSRVAEPKPSDSAIRTYRTQFKTIAALRKSDVQSAAHRIDLLEKLVKRESAINSKRATSFKPENRPSSGGVAKITNPQRQSVPVRQSKNRSQTIVTKLRVDPSEAIKGRELDTKSATLRIKKLQSLSASERAIASQNGASFKSAIGEAQAAATNIDKARKSISAPAKLTLDVSETIEARLRDSESASKHADKIKSTSTAVRNDVGKLGRMPKVSAVVKLNVDSSAAIAGRERDVKSASSRMGVLQNLAKQESAIRQKSVSDAMAQRAKLSKVAEGLRSSFKAEKPIELKVAAKADGRVIERVRSSLASAKPVELTVGLKGAEAVRRSVESITKEIKSFRKVAAVKAKATVVVDDAALDRSRGKMLSFAKASEATTRQSARATQQASAMEAKAIEETVRVRSAAAVVGGRLSTKSRNDAQRHSASWKGAYKDESSAASSTFSKIQVGRQRVSDTASRSADSLYTIANGIKSLGIADGGAADAVLRKLSLVQESTDAVRGGYQFVKMGIDGIKGFRTVLLGKAAATRADVSASKMAEASSRSLQRVIRAESLAAKEAGVAHDLLNRKRSRRPTGRSSSSRRRGAGVAAGAVGSVGLIAAGGGGGGTVAIEGVSLLVDALQDSASAAKLQTRGLSALKTTTTRITSMATRLGVPAVAAQLGALGKSGIALVGSFGAVAAAGTAAVGGIAFAGKSAMEFAGDIKQAGFMGGAAVGGWSDSIAQAEVKTLSWVGTTTGAFSLINDAATKESASRLQLFQTEQQRKMQHWDTIERMEVDRLSKLRNITESLAGKRFNLRQTIAKTPQEKLGNITQEVARLEESLSAFDKQTNKRRENLEGQESEAIGNVALARQQGRTEDAAAAEKRVLDAKAALQQFQDQRNSKRSRIVNDIDSKRFDQINATKEVRGQQREKVSERVEQINQQLIESRQRLKDTRTKLLQSQGVDPTKNEPQSPKFKAPRGDIQEYQRAVADHENRAREVSKMFGVSPEEVKLKTEKAFQQRQKNKAAGKDSEPLNVTLLGEEKITAQFDVHTDELVNEIGQKIESGQREMHDRLKKAVLDQVEQSNRDAASFIASQGAAG